MTTDENTYIYPIGRFSIKDNFDNGTQKITSTLSGTNGIYLNGSPIELSTTNLIINNNDGVSTGNLSVNLHAGSLFDYVTLKFEKGILISAVNSND